MSEAAIPAGWDRKPIKAVAKITTGDKDTKDRVENGLYPFFVRSQTVERINSVGFDGEGVLTAGDGVGTGKIFHYINGKCDFHQRVYLMHSFSEGVTGRYFFYYFSHFFFDRIMAMTAKSSVDSVRREMIADMEILFPKDGSEQQAIAAALSDADGVVAGLERVIAKKRLIKQGAMQDLLTARRRLPGFSGEWEAKRLAELGDVKTGLTYKPENVKPFGTLVLRSSNIQNDRLAFDNNVFVDVAVSDEATVKAGDLLICVRNGSRQLIGKTAMIDKRADGMAFGAFMSAFRSEVNDYLLWCFQSSVVQDQIAENLGATINQITNKTMKEIEIPLPKDGTERQAISAVLSDMDAEIQTLESRLSKARAVKEGMMQNLLTGRVRLV